MHGPEALWRAWLVRIATVLPSLKSISANSGPTSGSAVQVNICHVNGADMKSFKLATEWFTCMQLGRGRVTRHQVGGCQSFSANQ